MSKTPKKTDENGRDENGRFTDGNKGKPKGATNKTTKEVKQFITNFLNDKLFEIEHIWNTLDDREKANLFIHLSKLVLPKSNENDVLSNIEIMTKAERQKRIDELKRKLIDS